MKLSVGSDDGLNSNHCENIVGAIRHIINKEKSYLDSIKEIIYCYDNIVCCSQEKQKYRHYPYHFYIFIFKIYYLKDCELIKAYIY
jgi:hypothetical protein